MTLEEKVRVYKELGQKIAEMELQKKAIVAEILQLFPKEAKTVQVAEYSVKRMARLTIKTSLENARQIGAVKFEELVDKDKIKQLVYRGHAVPDVSEIQYIQVTHSPEKL